MQNVSSLLMLKAALFCVSFLAEDTWATQSNESQILRGSWRRLHFKTNLNPETVLRLADVQTYCTLQLVHLAALEIRTVEILHVNAFCNYIHKKLSTYIPDSLTVTNVSYFSAWRELFLSFQELLNRWVLFIVYKCNDFGLTGHLNIMLFSKKHSIIILSSAYSFFFHISVQWCWTPNYIRTGVLLSATGKH